MRSELMGGLAVMFLSVAPGALAQTTPSPIVPRDRPDQAPVETSPRAEGPERRQAASLPQITPFQLQRVEVSGSSLSRAQLEAVSRPFVGRTVDAAALVQITDAIIAAYERSNVALYTVVAPNQDFAGGVLRINVLEGHVQAVQIEGDPDPKARALVRRYLEKLTAERPLTRTTLERYVSLTRDLPGVRTDISFLGGDTDGAVRLVARVDANPVQVGVSANNRGAAFLGRTQIAADLYLNNVIAAGGQSRLTLAAPTDWNRFQYVALGHNQLLGTSGATLQVSGGYLRTRPRGVEVDGEATSAGIQLTYPIVRSYDADLYVTAGVDGLNANSAFLGSTFSDDRSRAARVNLLYARQSPRMRWSLSGAVSVGLDALGARTLAPDATDLSFVKFNARAGFATQLAERIVLRLAAAGQQSDDRLPAAEQFAIGGNEFGRAYEAAALMGDQGYAGSAELAFRPGGLPSALRDAEAYGFVDGAKSYFAARPGIAEAENDLSSAGLGVRATVLERVAVQVEATHALEASNPALDQRRAETVVFSLRTVW